MRAGPPLALLWLQLLPLPALPDADLSAFAVRGQVVTRKLLPPGDVGLLSQRLSLLFLEHGRRAFGGGAGEKEVRFTFAVHELDAGLRSFLRRRSGELWQAAAAFAGTSELCVLMDRGFSKDPGDPETHWHRDDEAIGLPALHPGLRTVHAWIPLTAMGREMGTLRYAVGTQRRSYNLLERLLASLWGWEVAWFLTAEQAQDDLLELGDVAWHEGWLLHSAGRNAEGAVRNGLAVSFLYCGEEGGCRGLARRLNNTEVGCRAHERLFGAEWRRRHRSGEEDYAKTAIEEPFHARAARFAWRSLFGVGCGLAAHALSVRCGKRKEA